MPVFRGSRYEGVKFTGILGSDGRVRRFLHAREPLRIADMRSPIVLHSIQRGDALDALASRAAGKPLLWWLIADVNDVMFALDIEPGTEIAVPTAELLSRRVFGG